MFNKLNMNNIGKCNANHLVLIALSKDFLIKVFKRFESTTRSSHLI